MLKLHLGDCLEFMRDMPSESVDLVVTSPPYPGVEKMWGELFAPDNFDNAHLWLDRVWNECARVVRPGGRICINVANIGRRPYLNNAGRIASWGNDCATVIPEGEIIWHKGDGTAQNTAWGTFRNPADPLMVDQHEYILVFRKVGQRNIVTREYVIDRDSFIKWRNSVWVIRAASALKAQHIAPFPPELPMRLITLYSFVGETVLDPFLGSGTTLMEAKKLGRNGIGIEQNLKYFELAERNLSQGVMALDLV